MTQPDAEGPLGRSRIERVHLRRALDSESLEPFDLVRVVDADGDPELAGMALAGTLHRLPDGSDLAEPYVYHARSAQALVLVVPPAARHREMIARHELMRELEALDSVPAYAFDFRVVVDPTALRTALAWHRPSLPPPLVESVSDDELDELAETSPELTPELLSHLATDVVDDAEAASLEEVEELDSVDSDAVEYLDDEPAGQVQSFLDGASGEFALVDADWVTPYQDDDTDDDDEEPFTLDDADLVAVPESYSTLTELPSELPVGVAPPADFERDARRLRAGLFKGRVWLFARTRPGVFERDGIDAAVQHATVGGRSVALVSLADLTADRAEAVRLATDLASPSPRTLLGVLAKDFVLSVAFFHEGRVPVRCVELRSAREANVAHLLTLPTAPAANAVDVETAVARALAAPPPLDSTEHPFQVRRTSTSAAELRAEIRSVARWLEPARRDRVRLGLGVPEPVIQQVCQAVVAAALAKGIALPPVLMQWAVSSGLAEGPAEIVRKQLAAFLALTSEPDRGGLRDADVVSNWNALRGAASAFAVDIPPAIADVLHAMDSEDVTHGPGALEALNIAALLELTRHANHRGAATAELLRRDAALHAEAIGLALRDMRREEVVALVPALVRAGELVVPTLLETLSAKKTFVRQAAALTLASLQAEAAIPGLLELVAVESTTLWEEFARALAAFGELAEAAVVDALARDAIPPDRAALVLAYLAKGGFASSVDELTRSPDPRIASVAGKVGPRMATVERHLREFYDASTTPTGPREFGKKLFRALHPDSLR